MTDAIESQSWLGGGAMAELIRARDWSKTPLGPIEKWPQSLRTTVSLCLSSNFPINIIWGPNAIQIYNDGYKPICGAFYRDVLGADYRVTWESAWPVLAESFNKARAGQTSFLENQRMFLERNGYPEETFFTFSLSPIRDELGGVAGLFHPVTETTTQFLSERRNKTLRDVAARTGKGHSVQEVCELTIQTLRDYDLDIPFAALYLFGQGEKQKPYFAATQDLPVKLPANWKSEPLIIEDFEKEYASLRCGTYPETIKKGVALPLRAAGAEKPLGVLILGVSTRLPFNRVYEEFHEMLLSTVAAALSGARAYEEEKKRAEVLAELDRSKTAFFSNVSHEFRTPLTLMLGPLEDLIAGRQGSLPPPAREEAEVIHRNALRLLKLVNALLDFSRIEAGRVNSDFVATDLALLTRNLASSFRSAIENAGMSLDLKIEDLKQPVFVDRDMWEKIVLNLLSNAFKFTVKGSITVSLRQSKSQVELSVRDTGTGIPAAELPKLFQRFHRVQGAQGRTYEGSGIGLALVQELVKIHKGSVIVDSTLGQGSTFKVLIPLGSDHLPQDQVSLKDRELVTSQHRLDAYAGEAKRWQAPDKLCETSTSSGPRKKIVLADDNSDMRDYVKNLLVQDYEVVSVSNGQLALEAVKSHHADMLISDIMMPVLDGVELTKTLRSDPNLNTIPIILLSARAGDEARISGIEIGADDYLVKPFSSKELVARVRMQLDMVKTRREVSRKEKETELLMETVRERDEFMSIASHELRTPITSLKLQTQLLNRICTKEGLSGAKELATQAMDISLRQIGRLTHLVEDLLDVSRIQSGKLNYNFETFEMGALIRDVIERFSTQFQEAKCRLHLNLDEKIEGNWDRGRLDQVLMNLFSNCTKYAPGSDVTVGLARCKTGLQLVVHDTGPGISKERQPFVFDRFQRATSARNISGLGLGLFIVRGIVEAHHGNIFLDSEVGKGSRFTVTLPLNGEKGGEDGNA